MKNYWLNLSLLVFILLSVSACNGTKKVATAEQPASKTYKLSGNEPFWSVEITDGGITFTQMGSETIYFPAAIAKAGGSNKIYDTTTSVEGKTMEMRIIMEDKPCADTMADKNYAYKVTVTMNGKTYRGCGEEVIM